jgi:hypothetical protein
MFFLSVVMMINIDHSLNTEVPLDFYQSAEKGLDHDGPHRPITIASVISYPAI